MFRGGDREGGRDREFVECLAAATGKGDATDTVLICGVFSGGRWEDGRDTEFVECLAAATGRGDATENVWSVY